VQTAAAFAHPMLWNLSQKPRVFYGVLGIGSGRSIAFNSQTGAWKRATRMFR
jgi:hypothetical protein